MKNNKKGNLPNLIIIGAQKSGTSSLHHYLGLHPQILMSVHKELNFFCQELTWNKGLNWYKAKFKGEAKIYGESSPSYTNYPEYRGVAKRMHSLIPQAKLIYIVRDPVKRIVSQYLDRVKGGQEKKSFNNALTDSQDTCYLWFSKYYNQLKEFLKFYPKEQILILKADDLKHNRLKTLRAVFNFLEVDDSFVCSEFEQLVNVSDTKLKKPKPRRWVRFYLSQRLGAKLMRLVTPFLEEKIRADLAKGSVIERPIVDKELRKRLLDILRPDIEQLSDLTGLSFSEWFN